jgi:glutamate dehydrogenase
MLQVPTGKTESNYLPRMTISVDSPEQSFPAVRSGLIDELRDFITDSEEADGELLCDFTHEFFAKVPRQLVAERSIADLAALTKGAFGLLSRADEDGVTVEVLDPTAEGWKADVTVIRAELRDRPFIVDTIREYLNSESLPIQHYVYPVVGVDRREDGTIERVVPGEQASPRALVHCEIPRIEGEARRAEIRDEIASRLGDVVAATDDFQAMLGALGRTARAVGAHRAVEPGRSAELQEVEDFLRWLAEENFVFLGYREYEAVMEADPPILRVRPGSGLGILRREDQSMWSPGVPLSAVPEELRRRILDGPLLITTKTNAESTVHRRARMDYIGVKRLSETGEVVAEHRFLGLFTSKAYAEHADAIPILRRKLEAILASSGALVGSHDYKEIITIFNSMPKEDLFQASVEELAEEIQTVLSVLFSDDVEVMLRRDPLGRGVSVTIILPRGRFSGQVRQRIQDVLTKRLTGTILNYHLAMSAGDQARLHFYVSSPREIAESARAEDLIGEIRQIMRSWDDQLHDALATRLGESTAGRLVGLYSTAFSEEYRAATLPEAAVQDVEEFERLRASGGTVAISLSEPRGRGRAEAFRRITALKLYLLGERMILSDFMPILDNAGLRVIEVTPFVVSAQRLPEMMIYSFAVQSVDGETIPADRAPILAEALLAIREGDTLNDPFNALVLRAGLRWHQVDIVRTYGNYAFQAGMNPTRFGTARALARHPELARRIVDLFTALHDPAGPAAEGGESAEQLLSSVRTKIHDALESVTTLADDRAIRRIVALVEATTRTNYFSGGGPDPRKRSGGVPYISIKIRAPEVEELRRSGLLYEVFVLSSRMEGIHLRGAEVARGGIRWSDRPDDFRAEVLGLVQTQMIKNALIIPAGSKGGFITRRNPAERQALMAEVAEQYRTLIRGMLDVTDNIVDGVIVPPADVVRRDGDDPYLVVAADKGTAHLSDVANAVAAEYDFWLGDAFASGGSQGYDHKKEGITARGAWECVRRHFRELGKDIQEEAFTVAGIGDMSGDVFGNGMLLSRKIKLVAAFDHRHIFIDPNPDPERSFEERERLFGLGRGSWEDYDQSLLSAGAMIVPRASKSVPISAEARDSLGLDPGVSTLDGESLVRAVLRAPVELLWNGGIGTYVKDEEETNTEVGDSTNDPVRVDAHELRCKVVGEGGNLGMTQRARIAFALRGGRLNTDALDNSGGVDLSDHEVNLKVLLAPLVRSGVMGMDARNVLLHEVGTEVTRLVLRNSRRQSLAVSLDEKRSEESLGDFTALITAFERQRILDRRSVGIPSADELEDRAGDGLGLTRPTLSILLAYAKLHAKGRVLASGLPEDPVTEEYLREYFPDGAIEAVGPEQLAGHPLRREIVATELVNELVDVMGASFLHRVARDTGRSIERVVTAWYIAREISGAGQVRVALEESEGRYPSEIVYRWFFGLARVLDRTARWTIENVAPDAPIGRVVADLREGLTRLRREFGDLVSGEDLILFEQRVDELKQIGVGGPFAEELITLRFLPELLDILRIAREAGDDAIETARTYYAVADRLNVTWLQHALRSASRDDPWDRRLIGSLDADVHRAHRSIARRVLSGDDGIVEGSIAERITAFAARREGEAALYEELLSELRNSEAAPTSAFAVTVRALVALSNA